MSIIAARDADEWLDVASKSFVPLAFQSAASDFTARMDRRAFSDDVSIADISTQSLLIERTDRLAARARATARSSPR